MKNLQLILDTIRQQPFLWARFATHLLEQSNLLRRIQILLGHSSSKATERYTPLSKQEIRKPLHTFYNSQNGTIATAVGTIKPLRQRDKKNKRIKGICYHLNRTDLGVILPKNRPHTKVIN
jgi:hypothetical protein